MYVYIYTHTVALHSGPSSWGYGYPMVKGAATYGLPLCADHMFEKGLLSWQLPSMPTSGQKSGNWWANLNVSLNSNGCTHHTWRAGV